MAEFPQGEVNVKALASEIKGGLGTDPIFANPPLTPAQIETLLASLDAASNQQRDAQAIAAQKTTAKRDCRDGGLIRVAGITPIA